MLSKLILSLLVSVSASAFAADSIILSCQAPASADVDAFRIKRGADGALYKELQTGSSLKTSAVADKELRARHFSVSLGHDVVSIYFDPDMGWELQRSYESGYIYYWDLECTGKLPAK
jgi:hypothetical protein